VITLSDFKPDDIEYSSRISISEDKKETARYIYILVEKSQDAFDFAQRIEIDYQYE